MIDFIRGELSYVQNDTVTLEVQGIGYMMAVSARTLAQLPSLGQRALLYAHLQVLDNEFKLYGFMTREEQQLFQTLLGVSGMGARGAINVLSSMEPGQFYAALASQDEKSLLRIPGVGKKMAQRLLFELHDKLPQPSVLSPDKPELAAADQVLEALEVLGYNRAETYPILRELTEAGQLSERVEDNIKLVLKRKAAQSVR